MEKIKKYKGYVIIISLIIISVISLIVQTIDRKNVLKINGNEIVKEDGKVAVYVTGEVKNPGVYYLSDGARISNLLDACGGVTNDADINKINLAQKLIDSDKISIPKKVNELLYDETDEGEDIKENEDDKININTASKDELKSLDGIGEATAQKIIDYRKKEKFYSIEDIMNVPSIGESKFDSIKDNICVD